MIAKKLCPHNKTRSKHYIEVNTELDSFNCPICGKEIIISHCLNERRKGSKRAYGIVLFAVPTKQNEFIKKIKKYLERHTSRTVAEISRDLQCSNDKVRYVLRNKPDEFVIKKVGRRYVVGAKA